MYVKRLLRSRMADIVLLLLISVIVHRNWFQDDTLIAGEVTYYPGSYVAGSVGSPHMWDATKNAGGPSGVYLYRHPFLFMRGLLTRWFGEGVSDLLAYKIPLVAVPVLAMYCLIYFLLKKDRTACFVGSLFFSLNTYVLHLSRGGQSHGAIAVALAPLPILFAIKGIKHGDLRYSVAGGLALALQACLTARSAYLTALIIVMYMVLHLCCLAGRRVTHRKHSAFLAVRAVAVILVLTACLHLYWVLPLSVQRGVSAPSSLGQPYWIYDHNSVTLARAATLFHPWDTLQQENVGPVRLEDVRSLYWLLPVLALGAPLLSRRRDIWFIVLIAAAFVFLAKGAHPPLGRLYIWCFKNVPGFQGFRDPSKFFLGVSCMYAVLLGCSVSGICRAVAMAAPGRLRYLSKAFLVLSVAGMLYLVYPHCKDQLVGGTYLPRPMGEDYLEVRDFIRADRGRFRTLWHPLRGTYAFYSPAYPYISGGDYHQLDLYLYRMDINKRCLDQTTRWGKLVGLLNAKYIVLPPITVGEWVYDAFKTTREEHRDRLLEQQDISETSCRWVLLNESHLPRFYTASSAAVVAGGMGSLVGLAELSGEYQLFEDLVVFFSDDLKERTADVLARADLLVFYGQDEGELALAMTGPGPRLDLWDYAVYSGENDPVGSRFGRTVWPPYGDLGHQAGELAQSGKGVVDYSDPTKEHRMRVGFEVVESDRYELWMRMGFSGKNGTMELSLDGRQVGVVETKRERSRYGWVRISDRVLSEGEHFLEVRSRPDGKQQLDQLVVLKRKDRERQDELVAGFLENKTVLRLFPPGPDGGAWRLLSGTWEDVQVQDFLEAGTGGGVGWTMVSPTRYELDFAQERPGYLVFSETYSPHWQFTPQGGRAVASGRAYGRINAFYVERTGRIKGVIEYLPERHMVLGGKIGIAAALACAGIVLVLGRRERMRQQPEGQGRRAVEAR